MEDARTARRYFSSLKIFESIEELNIQTLDKNTREDALNVLMEPLDRGIDIGIVSESGCPGVADPGAIAVAYAHDRNIKVVPLVGPSSVLLALMASGLNGQCFAFHGYLPIEAKGAGIAIKEFERQSKKKNQTQIFIETPYRNNSILDLLLKNLSSQTQLCLAVEVTGKNEWIVTKSIQQWLSKKPELTKTPAIFLFLAK